MTKLTDKIFHNEDAARAHFERIRWSEGRVCFHCGTVDNSVLLKGKSTRPGLYKCRDCRKPFTATMGTIYERSRIPLHKWLLATHLMVSSKKGIPALQLHRNLGFGSYRTAWFMAHRIREAMKSSDTTPMGSGGGDVFADETYFGRDPDRPKSRTAHRNVNQILKLVDRTTGRSTSVVFDKDPFTPWRGEKANVTVASHDVEFFGDGSVIALHAPGHTPDHLSLLVKLASGPVLISGDLYHAQIAREKRGMPPFNSSRAETLASMDRFERLAKVLHAKVIIPHEPADIAKLPAFPRAAQ